MRRLLAAAALGGVLIVLLAGCSKTEGVDGDIADDWRPMPEAKPFVPKAGVCGIVGYARVSYLSTYNPVDCAESHYTETSYVGTFGGADAARVSPPPAGSPAMRAAYAECDKQAKAYLGDDWRTARLWLGVTVPSAEAWSGGGRWFRCELVEEVDVEGGGNDVRRTGSLKAALTGASPLRLGCYTAKVAKKGDIEEMAAVDCTKAHQAEFVGVYTAPDVTYPSGDKHRNIIVPGCQGVLAKFANVPNDGQISYRSGLIWFSAGEDDWRAGDRGIRCYLWMDDRNLKKSMRNAGPAGLPIR